MTMRIRMLLACGALSALASCGDRQPQGNPTPRTDAANQMGRKTPPSVPLKMDAGSPDERLQAATDGLPDDVRMNAVALAACRSMRDGGSPTTETRISTLMRAATDVRADPSAASDCIRALGARTAPPPARRN